MSAGDETAPAQPWSLFDGVRQAGMNFDELWLQQLSVGGEAGRMEVEAYVLGLLRADPHQHDVIAQAINEHFIGRGENHPVAYADQRVD